VDFWCHPPNSELNL